MEELIGRRVREARKAKGWSLEDLSGRAGMSMAQLSKLENGHATLKVPSLVRLATELERPVAYFLHIEDETLRCLGTLVPAWDAEGQAIDYFAKLVAEKTDGALSIAVFSGSQLGSATSQIDALRTGVIDMFVEYLGFLERFADPLRIASLPFCFEDAAHYDRFLHSDLFDREVRQVLRDNSIELPKAEWNWKRGDHLVLVAKQPITSPDQLRGLRMRIHESDILGRFMEQLGTTPVVVPWAGVYDAFAAGEFDAMITELSHVVSMRFTRVAPALTLLGDRPRDLTLGMNVHKYQMLSPSIQSALEEAAIAAGLHCAELVERAEADLPRVLDEDGAIVIQVGVGAWRDRCRAAIHELERAGLWEQGLFGRIQDLKGH